MWGFPDTWQGWALLDWNAGNRGDRHTSGRCGVDKPNKISKENLFLGLRGSRLCKSAVDVIFRRRQRRRCGSGGEATVSFG